MKITISYVSVDGAQNFQSREEKKNWEKSNQYSKGKKMTKDGLKSDGRNKAKRISYLEIGRVKFLHKRNHFLWLSQEKEKRKKHIKPQLYAIYRTHLNWKSIKMFKKRNSLLTSDKVEFKSKVLNKEKSYFMSMKGYSAVMILQN